MTRSRRVHPDRLAMFGTAERPEDRVAFGNEMAASLDDIGQGHVAMAANTAAYDLVVTL